MDGGAPRELNAFARCTVPDSVPPVPRSALSREISDEAPPAVSRAGVRAGSAQAGAANQDNLNLRLTVDVNGAPRELNVFARCSVDQVISMVLRQCIADDHGTDWGNDGDYELYLHDDHAAGGVNPDMPSLQGSQKIGQYAHLNFILVRAFSSEAEMDMPPRTPPALAPAELDKDTAEIPPPADRPPAPPPTAAVEQTAAEELLQNVGTQNVCKQCSERIDFGQVSPDKIGELKKQMDHTGLWKPRWFQLYGNHLVYWSDSKEDLDLASGRGVIHLDKDVVISTGRPSAPESEVSVLESKRAYPPGAGSNAARQTATIMAGSVSGSAIAGDETDAGRKLLTRPGEIDSLIDDEDPDLDEIDDEQQLEFAIKLPHRRTYYNFRAETEHERDSWVAALRLATQRLFHTCMYCWQNVDPSSSGLRVACRGYLHIQLAEKLTKQWDRRWMVCTADSRGLHHVTYYEDEAHEGQRPALGCIHLYEPSETRVAIHASEFEMRVDESGTQYTFYKLNLRRGDERLVIYRRWSRCDKFHRDIAKQHKLPATVQLPKKWNQTTDRQRLDKRRCQLNHYFAELSGWANRHGLDLWQCDAFQDFVKEGDERGANSAAEVYPDGSPPLIASVRPDDQDGSSYDDSYASISRRRARSNASGERVGSSFAFGVSVTANSSPSAPEPEPEPSLLEPVPSSDGADAKHYLHLQSPFRTYYLYADTQRDLDLWLGLSGDPHVLVDQLRISLSERRL